MYGVGVNDVKGAYKTKCYSVWTDMLMRCYDAKRHELQPAYIDCSVCPEWHTLSNFKLWFDANYIEGYQLDKDLLIVGNKIYSPITCFFVPSQLNSLMTRNVRNGDYPVGVSNQSKSSSVYPYRAQLMSNGKAIYAQTFATVEEASVAYQEAKRTHILEELERYDLEGGVDKRLLIALEERFVQ
ncbi:hypothetical protein MYOV003v1_p0122 [Vibrio phage 207E48.1]|nr:hypothetical protein MYOV003v1_p0122 [Vibrio phage 207E48.1]